MLTWLYQFSASPLPWLIFVKSSPSRYTLSSYTIFEHLPRDYRIRHTLNGFDMLNCCEHGGAGGELEGGGIVVER